MTFPEQIANIPLLLVQQGWRVTPPSTTIQQWLKTYFEAGWETSEHDGLPIWQPVIRIGEQKVYAHQGWGDGLAPSPEMVKVWSFWWISMGDGTKPVTVTFHDGAMIVDGVNSRYLGMHKWRGPVLPPVLP